MVRPDSLRQCGPIVQDEMRYRVPNTEMPSRNSRSDNSIVVVVVDKSERDEYRDSYAAIRDVENQSGVFFEQRV
eukprot:521154-Hanusia_phi.AAC.1